MKNEISQNLYVDDRLVGTMTADADHVWFEYDSEWLKNGFPLSSGLPLTEKPIRLSAGVFLRNLFPEEKRRDLAVKLKRVSPDLIIPFLRLYGDDLPGAISIAPAGANQEETDVTHLAARLVERRLPLDMLGGRLSLAGADPKAGVIARQVEGEWRLFARKGKTLSTHILKATDTLAEAEAIGMEAARLCGLDVCDSCLINLEGNPAYLVRRYDRVLQNGEWRKIQQEDFCQKLGIPETNKYLNDANGAISENANRMLARVLDGLDETEKWKWLRASIFNIVFGNTDDHAKNYSFLIMDEKWKLAPLYDIISARTLKKTFPEWNELSLLLSRPFGRVLNPSLITHRDFFRHAEIFGVDVRQLIREWNSICQTIESKLSGFADHFLEKRVPHGLAPTKLEDIETLCAATEKYGKRFAKAMHEIGERADRNIQSKSLKSKKHLKM